MKKVLFIAVLFIVIVATVGCIETMKDSDDKTLSPTMRALLTRIKLMGPSDVLSLQQILDLLEEEGVTTSQMEAVMENISYQNIELTFDGNFFEEWNKHFDGNFMKFFEQYFDGNFVEEWSKQDHNTLNKLNWSEAGHTMDTSLDMNEQNIDDGNNAVFKGKVGIGNKITGLVSSAPLWLYHEFNKDADNSMLVSTVRQMVPITSPNYLRNLAFEIRYYGSGATHYRMNAIQGTTYIMAGAGNVDGARAKFTSIENQSTSTISSAISDRSSIVQTADGRITSAVDYWGSNTISDGNVIQLVVFGAENPNITGNAKVENFVVLYIPPITGATNAYGIYQAPTSTAPSVIRGDFNFGSDINCAQTIYATALKAVNINIDQNINVRRIVPQADSLFVIPRVGASYNGLYVIGDDGAGMTPFLGISVDEAFSYYMHMELDNQGSGLFAGRIIGTSLDYLYFGSSATPEIIIEAGTDILLNKKTIIDGNLWVRGSGTSIFDEDVNFSKDVNVSKTTTSTKYCFGDSISGDCITGSWESLRTDTNAQIACDVNQFLSGDGSCNDMLWIEKTTDVITYLFVAATNTEGFLPFRQWQDEIMGVVAGPVTPRNITISTRPFFPLVMTGTVTITGIDTDGAALEEVFIINEDALTTHIGNKAFAKITGIATDQTDVGIGHLYSVGWGEKIGLPNYPFNATSDVFKIVINNVDMVLTDFTINATYGTIKLDGGLIDGQHHTYWYRPFK